MTGLNCGAVDGLVTADRASMELAVVFTHAVDLCRPTSPYLLHPYNRTRVISTDATMDPARPTRFEKKKNMLPNVPHAQQFHVWTWS